MQTLDPSTLLFIGTVVSALVAYAMVSLGVATRLLDWRRPTLCPACGVSSDKCRCR
jgi:hypothetical protein